MNPEQDLDLALASLSVGASGSEEWHSLYVGHVLGGTSANTDIGIGKYTGNWMIVLSVLDGGSNNASKFRHYTSSPIRFSRDGNI